MGFDLGEVRRRMPSRALHWHRRMDSTMTEASRLAAEGCASGTAVIADEQTAGIGRHGHSWHSEAGLGLYVSVVLRQKFVDSFPGVTLAVGLAAREAIVEATGVVCDLRWPNDLLIGGRKCAGILLNLESKAIIAGIGINVNHGGFPEQLRELATSLRIAAGREFRREHLLVELLLAMERYTKLIEEEGIKPVLRLFAQASSYVSGMRVRVEQGETALEGVTAGLDESGFLLLRQDNGKLVTVLAGGVRPAS
ncbi:MAG: biotin--[acetyl-CoA-carboxylase] ligase [Acidimicrobiia bacterium]|nr:biotin--[acetyl-CoA-carboxylase] ligase [Acidimicrobiia bacterium]